MNYQKWIDHFRANRLDRPEPDWAAPFTLPEEKRKLLALSLAEYQLGDGGGECRLVAHDAECYRESAEHARTVVGLWFAEEREHSRLLACAVERVGGKLITSTFAFRLFYACRRACGVQFEMLVLLVVEIVSTGYYRVLRQHVGDAAIADMCKLILRDEARHIDFHRDRLAARHPLGLHAWWAIQFRLLGLACAMFLWLGHGRCLRALGATRSELFGHVRSGSDNFLAELSRACGRASSDLPHGTAALPATASASSAGPTRALGRAPGRAR
jgi:hypothetical protein